MPIALNISTINFIDIANIIFCFTIVIVFLEIFIASTTLDGSSVINTTSAASIAASLPSPPIAIPMSEIAKTGASLIPSPIKAKFPFSDLFFINSSTFSTLSLGSNSV